MILAGIAAIIGSALDWVTITVRPELREGADFGDEAEVDEPRVSEPFTGLQARDGWWTLVGGAVLLLSGALLLVRKRSFWGWTGLIGAVVVGAVAIADYRGIGDLSSSISQRMDVVGGTEPGVGLTIVVAAAVAGLLGSVAGIAASPQRTAEE
jgi:hypothetical protein